MKHQSLETALKTMTAEEDLSRDFICNRTDLNMSFDHMSLNSAPALKISEEINMPLNDWAHSQLAGKLDIPTKYYNKMLSSERQLLCNNVNTWLHKPKIDQSVKVNKLLIRTTDKKVRGILSDKYKPISNKAIALFTLNTLSEIKEKNNIDIAVREIVTNEQNIYLKFTSNQGFMMNEPTKDLWYPGIMVRNSEVGASMFKVDVYTWRQWCKNGAILTNGLSKVHLGSKIQGQGEINFSEMTEKLNIAAIMSAMKDVMIQVFIPETFNALLNRIKNSQNVTVNNPEKAVELVSKKFKFTTLEEKSILDRFGQKTQYGLGNAITELGRDSSSETRQIDLETTGGEILLLEGDGFKSIINENRF